MRYLSKFQQRHQIESQVTVRLLKRLDRFTGSEKSPNKILVDADAFWTNEKEAKRWWTRATLV
jgi:hypothetical protein